MLKLDAICFRREVRLWGSHAPPRTWERREGLAYDRDWKNWDFEITDDMRFVIVKCVGARSGSPMEGKSFYVPLNAENVDSFLIFQAEPAVAEAFPETKTVRVTAPKTFKK